MEVLFCKLNLVYQFEKWAITEQPRRELQGPRSCRMQNESVHRSGHSSICRYRVFHANTRINRHFSVSGDVKKILKTVSYTYLYSRSHLDIPTRETHI